jgi:ABC transport system ATP-binding/permease protein
MPSEPFDWPGQQPPQAGSPSPAAAGFAHAGLAEAAPLPAGSAGGSALPDLLVRTQRSEHMLHGGTTYRIGRDPESDIVVADTRVSWRHGVLQVDGGGWVLEDIGSTNGTFVGVQRVNRVPISSDCVVRLGNPDDGPVLRCTPQAVAPPAPAEVAPPPRQQAPPPPPPPPPREQQPPPREQQPPPYQPPVQHLPPLQPSVAAPIREMLPSVDRRPTARMKLPAKAMRIGRIPDNDLVLVDLDVSRHHAELRKSPTGTYEIVDLGSHNGTFVNGRRISSSTVLSEADIVGIGHSTFRLAGGELRQFVDDGEVTFSAQDLVVKVAGGKVLLDRVTFPIPEKCLLGVIGPSGAGKSTLLGALTGMRPADTGTVLYDNRDLYRHYAELRFRIGLVPQESVLHTQLTARRALQYSAELRFPADTKASERDARVDEVMAELGLTKHASTRADRLSGGQLKRVNVAQELLTKPSLLFLDEPTSGLDPGLDKSVMEQMRDLAHDGRTVIVVTHSVANLDNCDRLLVLVPGGKVAFYGPPDEGLGYFGLPGWAEVFQAFERYPDRDWAAEYRESPVYAKYVAAQRPKAPPKLGGQQLPDEVPPPRRGGFRQFTTLTRRYVRVIASDRGYLTFMGLLPVVLGILTHFVGTSQGLAGPPHTNNSAQEVLLILVICACLSGAASSVRELVKERPIYIRERAAGLSSGSYLFSKLFVLGVISVVQSVILVLLGLGGRPLPPTGSFLTGAPLVELLLGIAFIAVASMCLGLLVSSLVSTSEKAMPFLVLLTMVQVILSGGVLSLSGKAGLTELSWLAPARWGFGAVASTANLNLINPAAGNFTDPLWDHTAKTWLIDMGMMIVLGVIFSLLAWIRIRRIGPRRRR